MVLLVKQLTGIFGAWHARRIPPGCNGLRIIRTFGQKGQLEL